MSSATIKAIGLGSIALPLETLLKETSMETDQDVPQTLAEEIWQAMEEAQARIKSAEDILDHLKGLHSELSILESDDYEDPLIRDSINSIEETQIAWKKDKVFFTRRVEILTALNTFLRYGFRLELPLHNILCLADNGGNFEAELQFIAERTPWKS